MVKSDLFSEKYLIRRNLDTYSELEYARFIQKKGYSAFYPFKDTGVDIVSYRDRAIEFYQLKARNEYRRQKGYYWFMINKKDVKKLLKFPKAFFVLCALQSDDRFAFFKLPTSTVKKWLELIERQTGKKKSHFLKIKRTNNGYELRPERIKDQINLSRYQEQ